MSATKTGLQILADDPQRLAGARVGLLTNYTGITPQLERGIDVLRRVGVRLSVLFGPEHGINGSAQAGYAETDSTDSETGLPVVDTYAAGGGFEAALTHHGVDVLLCDLQDVGVRYWTYVWSMYDAMLAAARAGVRFVVLDRPNPLAGRLVEGPVLHPAFASFVGRAEVRQRHGLTLGELARRFRDVDIPSSGQTAPELDVVAMEGWRRDMRWEDTGQSWVMPSPNLPTLDSVFAFAATGLLEGTNVSEGRGTTRPFELFGAPYFDAGLVQRLRSLGLPGVRFRAASFRPTFHKYAGLTLPGVQLHVTDRREYRPVRTGLAILAAAAELYPGDFAVADRDIGGAPEPARPALDRLWGSDTLRAALADGTDLASLPDMVSHDVAREYPIATLLY